MKIAAFQSDTGDDWNLAECFQAAPPGAASAAVPRHMVPQENVTEGVPGGGAAARAVGILPVRIVIPSPGVAVAEGSSQDCVERRVTSTNAGLRLRADADHTP